MKDLAYMARRSSEACDRSALESWGPPNAALSPIVPAVDHGSDKPLLIEAIRQLVRDTGGPASHRRLGDRPALTDGAARDLAAFVLRHLTAPSLPIDVEAIARDIGVQDVIHDRSLKTAGGLEFRDSRLTIVYGTSDPAARRETIAHELGHYLLRLIEAMPFKAQMGDPRVEDFCDQFARELLVPNAWLRARTPMRTNIEVALEISELTNTSVATAAAALLHSHEAPRGFLLLWRPRKGRGPDWLVSHSIGAESATYRSNISTVAALTAATTLTREVSFYLVRDGRVRLATADVVRIDSGVATWIHRLKALDGRSPTSGKNFRSHHLIAERPAPKG